MLLQFLRNVAVGAVVRLLANIERLRGRAGDGQINRSFVVAGFTVTWSYSPKDKSWWAYWGPRRPRRRSKP